MCRARRRPERARRADDLGGHTHPRILELARSLWRATWVASEPVLPEGEPPPFTVRQVEVALLLMAGHTDPAIAGRLELSPRTVAAEIARISSVLGVVGRTQVVAALSGAPTRPPGS